MYVALPKDYKAGKIAEESDIENWVSRCTERSLGKR